MKKITTTEEFDGEGRLVRRVVTTEDDGQLAPYSPYVVPDMPTTMPVPTYPVPNVTFGTFTSGDCLNATSDVVEKTNHGN